MISHKTVNTSGGGGGGGTEYADGTVQATPTGTVALGKDAADELKSLKVDATGQLYIANPGGGTGGTASNFTNTFPASGTAAGFTDGTDMQAAKVFDVDSGAGVENVLGVSIRKSNSGGSVEAATLSNPLRIDPTGTTAQPASQSGTWNITNVSGTVSLPTGAATAAKQPALGVAGTASADVISVQGVAGMTAVKTDGSAVTQPISAASLPLPGGAATSAKQPALGTAGTASADVITVQGITSMTPLKTDGSEVTQPISGTVTAQQSTATSLKAQAEVYQGGVAVSSSAPLQVTLSNTGSNTNAIKVDNSGVTQPISGTITANAGTNLNTSTLAVEAGGNLSTIAANTTNVPNVVGTAASAIPSKLLQIGGSDGTNARAIKTNTSGQLDVRPLTSSDQITTVPSGTQTVSGTVTANAGSGTFAANVSQINGVTPLMGNGVTGTGSQRVTVASDNTPFAVKTDQTTHGTTDLVAADLTKIAGTTTATGNGTASAGCQRVTIASDNSAVPISGTVTANEGTPSIAPPTAAYVRRFDYDGSGQPIYMGWAAPGTATSAASWAIQKLTWSATPGNCTLMQWCDGNTTADNVWDNRASLSYS